MPTELNVPAACAVVVNPVKVPDLDAFRETVTQTLTRAGWPAPVWHETTPEDPGRGQAARAIEDGAEVVFAAGGDGTVMACITALAGTDVALAILPAGTGNLLAANLGLSTDLTAGLGVAIEGGLRRLDVGRTEDSCFAVMAGLGFDAKMLDSTSETTKARIGWPAYIIGAVKHLGDRPMRVTISIDGGTPFHRRAKTVLIANVGRLQGGVRLLEAADPADGKLDVAVLSPRTLAQWAAMAWAVMRRRDRVPALEVFRGTRVSVTARHTEPRQLDGDLIAPGRGLDVEVLPKALWLCVPQPADHPDLTNDADAAAERAKRLVKKA
ncbi:diacylglycerol/lipid kinase family protein [Catenuloplanes atrovinosus]|uniref:Diacylglycerol kinase family enzyme n=1 Tax=Catenuloplanes atrovinosus TaxID=137266 RepID=A0AAE4C9U5_9ACTN|nr:diacylglycerol kinase family protein [Catenuloplanes atrovinosus]MDR7275159.1 diacylglycerol kinase family enzyme [Catenuloplanes atrovinosus]